MESTPYALISPENQFPTIAYLVDFAISLGIGISVIETRTGIIKVIFNTKNVNIESATEEKPTEEKPREFTEEERNLIYRVLRNSAHEFIKYG